MIEKVDKVVVAVIDSRRARREAMGKAFSRLAKVEYGWYDQTNNESRFATFAGSSLEVLTSPLLILRHFRDMRVASDLRSFTVYYGGHRPDEPDPDYIPKKHRERMWRAVHPDGKGALSSTEASEVLAYARKIIERSHQARRPKCLSRPINKQALSALAILCQGYLAAYSESQDCKLPEQVKMALKVMRWQRLGKNTALQADPELQALRTRLQDSWSAPIGTRTYAPKNPQGARWWLLPFKRGKSARPARTIARLCRDLQEEWNNYPSSIQNLLKLIRKPPVNKPAVVAQAYMSIALHLERRTGD